jgi:hypothetical protein
LTQEIPRSNRGGVTKIWQSPLKLVYYSNNYSTMSAGNLNEQGNGQRSNYRYQSAVLQLLGQIAGGSGGGGGATEATLLQVLSGIQALNDYEDIIVRDTVTSTLYIQERRLNETTGAITITYYDVAGTPFIPVNPMEYVSGGGSGTVVQFADGSAYSPGDIGTMALANNAGTYSPLQLDGSGYLNVHDPYVEAPLQASYKQANEGSTPQYTYGGVGNDGGFAVWAVRNDDQDPLTTANMRYSPMAVDSAGQLFIRNDTIEFTTLNSMNANQALISNVWDSTAIIQAVNFTLPVGGITTDYDNVGFRSMTPDFAAMLQLDTSGRLFVRDTDVNDAVQNLGPIANTLADVYTEIVGAHSNIDNAPLPSTNFNIWGGKAVNSAAYAPAYTIGDGAIPAFDRDTGRLLTQGSDSSTISTANSSTTTLGIGAAFTGTSEEITQYAEATIYVFSDVASATNGLSIQQSSNGVNWDSTDVYTIAAGVGAVFSVGVKARFFRIVYTNGGVAQGSFRLQTIFKRMMTKSSTVRPQDGRSNENDMEENLAYLMTWDPLGNVWNRFQTQDLYLTGQATQTATVNNILSAPAGATATDCVGFRSASVQVVSTGTAGTFIFEGSNDGVSFAAIPVFNQIILTGTPITAAITATNSQIIYTFPISFRYIRLRIATTITGGSIQAFTKLSQMPFAPAINQIAQGAAANLNVTATLASTTITSLVPGVAATSMGKAEDAVAASGDTGIFTLAVRRDTLTTSANATGDYNEMAVTQYGAQLVKNEEKHARTYSASAQVVPQAAATDILWIPGNATSIVYITKVVISGVASAARLQDVQAIKRSTANTAGTSSAPTVVLHDTNDGANNSTPIVYTANPTLGTAVGTIRRAYTSFGAATATEDNVMEFNFGDKGRPVVLRGVTQGLAINLAGTATLVTDTIDIAIEWYEI